MPEYTNMEMADMHFMYGRANGNAYEARRLYVEAYPNRLVPSDKIFTRLHQRLSDTGTFIRRTNGDAGRPRTVSTPATEVDILRRVEENPGISTRRLSAQININASLIWRTLHEQQLYPYHIQRVQALSAPDYAARRVFCQWILTKFAENPNFTSRILFTDEAGFTRDGIFNFHNNHVWADENPHEFVESRHQHRFSLNVWLGILGDRLIGPVFFPNRLTGELYLNFLRNDLPPLLEDVPLIDRLHIWLMHDGAPAHFSIAVRNFLNENFNGKWIGRGGPAAWPPRSPDLTPLDFFAWGHLKTMVYSRPVNNIQELRERIENACQIVRETPGIFERVRRSFLRRCEICMQMNGGHVEHLL